MLYPDNSFLKKYPVSDNSGSFGKIELDPWYDHMRFSLQTPGGELEPKTMTFHSAWPTDHKNLKGMDHITFCGNEYTYSPEFYHSWSPESPSLNAFELTRQGSDEKIVGRFGFVTMLVGQPQNEDAHFHLNGHRYFFNGVRLSDVKPSVKDLTLAKKKGFNAMFIRHSDLNESLALCADEIGLALLTDAPYHSDYIGLHPSVIDLSSAKNPVEDGMPFPICFHVSSIEDLWNTVFPAMEKGPGYNEWTMTQAELKKVDEKRLHTFYRAILSVLFLRPQDTASAKASVLNITEETAPKPGEVVKGQIVMLGDSITDFFNTQDLMSDYTLFNRGFSGNRSDQLYEVLPWTANLLNPEKITVLIGCNDIGHGVATDDFTPYLTLIAKELKKLCPKAEVHMLSVLPTNLECHWETEAHYGMCMSRPNSLLNDYRNKSAAICKKLGWQYHDISEAFMDENRKLSADISPEGLHLILPGNEIYAREIRKFL